LQKRSELSQEEIRELAGAGAKLQNAQWIFRRERPRFFLREVHAVRNKAGDDLCVNLGDEGIVGDVAGHQIFSPDLKPTLDVEVALQPPDYGE